jgi:hypothetical protein
MGRRLILTGRYVISRVLQEQGASRQAEELRLKLGFSSRLVLTRRRLLNLVRSIQTNQRYQGRNFGTPRVSATYDFQVCVPNTPNPIKPTDQRVNMLTEIPD